MTIDLHFSYYLKDVTLVQDFIIEHNGNNQKNNKQIDDMLCLCVVDTKRACVRSVTLLLYQLIFVQICSYLVGAHTFCKCSLHVGTNHHT